MPPPYGLNPSRKYVLVSVRCAGVNPVDAKFLYGDKFPFFLNVVRRFLEGRIAGIDYSGVVLAAEPGGRFRPGDEVFGTSK